MNKPLTLTPLLLGIVMIAGGCAIFAEQADKATTLAADFLTEYCENTPASERPAIKAAIEQKFGGKIDLTCP